MEILLRHVLLIIHALSIIKTSNTLGQDCNGEFRPVECAYYVFCFESSYLNIDYNQYNQFSYNCKSLSNEAQTFLPINIVYKRMFNLGSDYDSITWSGDIEYILSAVVRIDLSKNQFNSLPLTQTMQNLHFLNVSHNNFTVARLYKGIRFPNLLEIDFSYNKIIDVAVDDNFYVYDKLRKLDLSHNTINNIPEAVFERFGQLESLNLSYNNLKTLSILSFEGLKNLRSLQLEYNDLVDVNSSLLRFKYLEQLFLNNNKIVRILKQDFQYLYNLTNMDLSCNKISAIEKLTFQNMSFLSELNLSENAIELIDKDIFKYSNHLHSVNLYSNKLKHLPRELFKGKNMSFFSVQANSLQGELLEGMFFGLSNVKKLDLANQYLISIEDNAFIGLENLEILLLNDNKIKKVSKKSFTSLPNIKHLDISNNYIIVVDFDKRDLLSLQSLSLKNNFIMDIQQNDFNYLDNLEFLDLSNNNISKIHSNSFKALRRITDFEISNNPLISTLESSTFDGITLIPRLDVSFSRISLVKNNTFEYMTQLTYFNISHSLVSELQFNSLTYITRIVTIDMSFNRLTSFIVNTTDLQNLCKLQLNNNLITEITSTTLKNIPSLLQVSFSFNKLQSIRTNAFADQNSLMHLDLSFNPFLNINFFSNYTGLNNLRSLSFSGIVTDISLHDVNRNQITTLELSYARIKNLTRLRLDSFKHVEVLVLSNNEISAVDKEAFFQANHLQKLDLSYNKIKYVQPGAFKNNHNLLTLNISHNYLTAISYGTFRGLLELNILDLSYNYIESLEGQKFNEAENLNILVADNNKIHDLNYEELSGTKLSKLSIGDNPIDCTRLLELKQNLHFDITALREDEHSENVNGITCNKDRFMSEDNKPKGENIDSVKILKTLKSILINSSAPRVSEGSEFIGNELIANITDAIQNTNGGIMKQLLLLNDVNNQTNSLLQRLLKVVVIMNSSIKSSTPPLKANVTYDNITSYVNKIRQELKEDMIVQKESILADLDNKISMDINRKNILRNEMGLRDENTTKTSTSFIEICVVLVLILIVSLIIFKLYKWIKRGRVLTWRNTTLSRQQISESLENSNL